ncbi:MAG: SAM-dependent methyltransferase [Rhizobium sp.]|nr:MAG: SAM-dependent methyltransferase [Rhizobium sp.]
MSKYHGPLLTADVHEALLAAKARGGSLECSLDLGRSTVTIEPGASAWSWNGQPFPYPAVCKDRTIYYWDGESFEPVSRFSHSLIKLVPTEWGAPTFEIDGIKMLPTAPVSPYADAERKVGLVQPRGKVVLDTCGGLGYFAACCISAGATQILSFEKNPDVIWLRGLNSWSPDHEAENALALTHGDITEQVAKLPDASVDAILHDPPRFGIAGELYSQAFYEQLARVIRPRGRMFHYTGTPNKLTSRRDLPSEVAGRLQRAGFTTEMNGDGVVAVKRK